MMGIEQASLFIKNLNQLYRYASLIDVLIRTVFKKLSFAKISCLPPFDSYMPHKWWFSFNR